MKAKPVKQPVEPLTLKTLATRIGEHLRRFERDPKINVRHRYDREAGEWREDPNGVGDYYMANAHSNGRRVSVVYISYQGPSKLTRDRAVAYLAWLDAGNVGKHFDMERAK